MTAVWVAAALVLIGAIAWARCVRSPRPPPLPEAWRAMVRALPQACCVPDTLQARYEQRAEAFLRDKRFVGCNGLVVSDQMRVTVAGFAALLSLRDEATNFPAVRSVLLYPAAFLVRHDEPDEFGLVDDEPVEQIGESWQGDRIVLSWEDVEAALAGDAVNVAIHELAHQLDDEQPWSDGAPAMADYTRWSAVMQREYERLRRHRRPPVLDPYGAESPGEFFGVVSEAFFQRPVELRRHHAELYALLSDYYRLDPATHPPQWLPAA
ncbi:zinc-dependent peptidase [Solimonas marina]|uniref:Zinc-dependent peptidase n=1 Tax=Solimonas marina TaxID=2714601 RepID=A0A969W7V6_9GAMM|nr:M90 family metallopeptidase [Solimonas marina]NKF21109.1 zinc-dependent peptidase [Solimonas marina]